MIILGIAAIGIALLFCAHDLWLEPSAFTCPENTKLEVRAGSGHPLRDSEVISSEARFAARFLIDTDGRIDTTEPTFVAGTYRAYAVQLRERGTCTIAATTHAREIELSPASFKSYAEEIDPERRIWNLRVQDGLEAQPVRERYTKFAKTIVHVGTGNLVSPVEAAGLPLEIKVESGRPGAEGKYTFRLLKHAEPLPDAWVRLHTPTDAPSRQARTDEAGEFQFVVPRGVVCLCCTVLTPSDSPDLDYESLWASLTLALRD